MAFSSGTFSLDAANPTTGTTISSTWAATVLNGIATGLTTCVLKDGTQTATAVVPFASGISVAAGSTLANYTTYASYTATVTLVGGAGNTVPVYTTNTGRWSRVGSTVFCDVLLSGDGGAEGAGTGAINVALPVTSGSAFPTGYSPVGEAINGTTEYMIYGTWGASATTIKLNYFSAATAQDDFIGDLQNNATREIRLHFNYEV